ncbi:MAG TPA: hypothetical protein VKK79_25055 [Candidatus Lokiarchaeia archaeon]|nr:hypothetical protein [Candidatus Lokiarchaeia archaeon]
MLVAAGLACGIALSIVLLRWVFPFNTGGNIPDYAAAPAVPLTTIFVIPCLCIRYVLWRDPTAFITRDTPAREKNRRAMQVFFPRGAPVTMGLVVFGFVLCVPLGSFLTTLGIMQTGPESDLFLPEWMFFAQVGIFWSGLLFAFSLLTPGIKLKRLHPDLNFQSALIIFQPVYSQHFGLDIDQAQSLRTLVFKKRFCGVAVPLLPILFLYAGWKLANSSQGWALTFLSISAVLAVVASFFYQKIGKQINAIKSEFLEENKSQFSTYLRQKGFPTNTQDPETREFLLFVSAAKVLGYSYQIYFLDLLWFGLFLLMAPVSCALLVFPVVPIFFGAAFILVIVRIRRHAQIQSNAGFALATPIFNIWTCPQCGSHDIREVEDLTRVVAIIPQPIFGTKLVCPWCSADLIFSDG